MLLLILLLVIAVVFVILGYINNSAKYIAISVLALIILLALRFGGMMR